MQAHLNVYGFGLLVYMAGGGWFLECSHVALSEGS